MEEVNPTEPQEEEIAPPEPLPIYPDPAPEPAPRKRSTRKADVVSLIPPSGVWRKFGFRGARTGNRYRAVPGEAVEVSTEDAAPLIAAGWREA